MYKQTVFIFLFSLLVHILTNLRSYFYIQLQATLNNYWIYSFWNLYFNYFYYFFTLFHLFFLHCSLYSKVLKIKTFPLLHIGKFVPFYLVFGLFYPSQSQHYQIESNLQNSYSIRFSTNFNYSYYKFLLWIMILFNIPFFWYLCIITICRRVGLSKFS